MVQSKDEYCYNFKKKKKKKRDYWDAQIKHNFDPQKMNIKTSRTK
jgi:hypothetical protein